MRLSPLMYGWHSSVSFLCFSMSNVLCMICNSSLEYMSVILINMLSMLLLLAPVLDRLSKSGMTLFCNMDEVL